MAEWKVYKFSPPPGLAEVVASVVPVVQQAADFVGAVADGADAAVDLLAAGFDDYRVIVNALITEVENLLNDISKAGVYVLVDYPQSLVTEPQLVLEAANLSGTIVDPEAIGMMTSNDVSDADRENYLQAVAASRKKWNPVARDMLNFSQAIGRIAGAFDDLEDPLRPLFSPSASTTGVVLMAHSEELAQLLRAVRQLTEILYIEDLRQSISYPGFSQFFADVGKAWDELSETDLANIDLNIPVEFRNGGRHPNFVMRSNVETLIPVVGELTAGLSALIDELRPSGDLTKFVKKVIEAMQEKVRRMQELADTLAALAENLQNSLGGSKFAAVVVNSSTGNAGFKNGLRSATGHPGFDRAFVVSVLLYAGGPGAEALKALFSSPTGPVQNSKLAATIAQQRHARRQT